MVGGIAVDIDEHREEAIVGEERGSDESSLSLRESGEMLGD